MTKGAAFTLHRAKARAIPVLVAVPHAGRAYPPQLLARARHPLAILQGLEDRFVDIIGRRAAEAAGADILIAHAPRALIDLNRSPDDLDSGMFARWEGKAKSVAIGPRSARGLGLFPRRLAGAGELWRQPMERSDGDRRIAQVHAPYHEMLTKVLAEKYARFGEVLLLDLHSMPSLAPVSGEAEPATHVLGDRFGASCDPALVAEAADCLRGEGVRLAVNRPYAGGYVLDRHGQPGSGIHALQLEIDRACYLESAGRIAGRGGDEQARLVTLLVKRMGELLAMRSGDRSAAAE